MLRKLGIGALSAFAAFALTLGGCSDDDGASCGDDVIEGNESCDGSNLGTETCVTQGFTGGTLACDDTCGFDTTGCYDQMCGNGTAEGTEDCDDVDLDGADCTDVGFTGGTLSCNADCTYDDAGCNNLCGNSTIDTGEACDGAEFGIQNCQTQGTFDGGTLTCSADCQTIETTNCCTNDCTTDGETSCNGDTLETCEMQTNGCLGITTYDCTGDSQVCDDSGATAVCADACTSTCTVVDETRCDNNNVETCTDNAGCLTWQVTDTCTAGSEVCLMPGTTATCVTSGGGDSCADVEVVSASVIVSGSDFTTDYTNSNDWGPNAGCGTANGADAVFQVWLDVGQVAHVVAGGGLDSVIRVLDTCDATSTCLESVDDSYSEELAFTPTAAGYYWIVIEAYSGSPTTTAYDFLVEILDDETDCGDGVDNDMDGNTDCDDPNCFGDTTYCAAETNCTDGADNDGDGDIDCDDSDCASTPACQDMIGIWEEFSSSSAVDVSDCTIAFTPDATTYQYNTTCGIGGLPITAGSGTVDSTVLTLGDSSSTEITLQGAWTIPFFAQSFGSFWVGSNGFVTFGAGDLYSDSSASYFFAYPRIAGLDDDLNPGAGGTVTVDEFADYVVITFDAVEDYYSSDAATFQIVIHSNGNIELHYGTMTILDDGIVGLSNGGFLGTAPAMTNFWTIPPAVGELFFTEIMSNPDAVTDANGEYVELYNASSRDIDLMGCTFEDNSSVHTFASVIIPAGGYLVLSTNDDSAANGGITGSYDAGAAMVLGNSGDIITLTCGGTVLDVVDFTSWSIDAVAGVTMQLSTLQWDETNNNLESSWCLSVDAYGDGDLGTPGTANNDCVAKTSLLSEDFSGTFPPTGWSIVDGGTASATWEQCTGCSRTLNGATGPYAMADSDAPGSGTTFDDELILPSVDCSGYTTCELSFLHYYSAGFSGDTGSVEVSIGGGAWTNIATYSSDTGNGDIETLTIPGAAGQADVRIRFWYVSGWDYYWLIDDVDISCF